MLFWLSFTRCDRSQVKWSQFVIIKNDVFTKSSKNNEPWQQIRRSEEQKIWSKHTLHRNRMCNSIPHGLCIWMCMGRCKFFFRFAIIALNWPLEISFQLVTCISFLVSTASPSLHRPTHRFHSILKMFRLFCVTYGNAIANSRISIDLIGFEANSSMFVSRNFDLPI